MEKKPRPYGNGSLYKTSDNRWVVKVSLGSGPDGKPITKRFSARTKAEAEQKLRSFKNEQRKHDMLSPIQFSVQDYFEYWLKTYQFQKLKPLSYDCLEGSIQNHLFPRLGKMNFGSVSRDDIQQLINDLYRQETGQNIGRCLPFRRTDPVHHLCILMQVPRHDSHRRQHQNDKHQYAYQQHKQSILLHILQSVHVRCISVIIHTPCPAFHTCCCGVIQEFTCFSVVQNDAVGKGHSVLGRIGDAA
ncbi:MAG: hypothetical protein E7326_07600 [Clostridiales bacterium]|nr:hypothetical protein [Clostridiales bacterium]